MRETLALAAVLLLAGCFKPNLGDEAFLCNKPPHECPDGYSCVEAEDGQLFCLKEGLPPPKLKDAGADAADAEQPQPDGPAPKPLCTTPREVAADNIGADLVVTKDNKPHVIFITPLSDIRHVIFDGNKWNAEDPGVGRKALRLDAALDDGDNLHILYVDDTTPTDIRHCYKPLTLKSKCKGDNVVNAAMKQVVSKIHSLAVDTNGKEIRLAVGFRSSDTLNNEKAKLIKIAPSAGSYAYSVACTHDPVVKDSPFSEVRLAVGLTHTIASYYVEGMVGPTPARFQIQTYPIDPKLTDCSNPLNSFDVQAQPTPQSGMGVAVNGPDYFVAYVIPKQGTSEPVGKVMTFNWPHGKPPSVTAKPSVAWAKETALLESPEIGLLGDKPFISFIEERPSGLVPVVIHQTKTGWQELEIPKLPSGVEAVSHTRIVVSEKHSTIHVGFDAQTGSGGPGNQFLYHFSCSGDFPP